MAKTREIALGVISLLVLVILSGCVQQNNGQVGPDDASGVVLVPSVKGCAATADGMATKSMAEGVEKEPQLVVSGNTITYSRAITHQCCRKIEVTKEVQGQLINIQETWTGEGCKCMCFSEISAELQNVPAGTYMVNVYAEDSVSGQELLVISQGATVGEASASNQATTKESCETAGGWWGQAGLNPQEVCIMPTADAGKMCFDSSACDGICEADPSSWAYTIAWMFHIPFPSTGVCSASMSSIGCHAYVENGMVYGVMCID